MSRSSNKSRIPATLIFFSIIIFFPVGIYLIYKKVTEDTTEILKSSRDTKKLGWVLITFALIYLLILNIGLETEDGQSAKEPLTMITVLFSGTGTIALLGSRMMRKRGERYEKCLEIVNSDQRNINNIADSLSISYEAAEKLLQRMINAGFFENNAYIDTLNKQIVLPSRLVKNQYTYAQTKVQYTSPAANFAKRKVVECPNCGADIEATEGSITECEYCGSRINV